MRKETIIAERRSKSSDDSTKRESTHICELSRGSDSNLLKLQPTASIRARLKRVFQKTIIVTGKHPSTRFYLRSHAAIAFEKKRHGRSPNWWVIHPCSGARLVWEIIMILNYLFCFVAIPYTSAFYMLNTQAYHEEESVLIPAFFICIIDIFMNFITGYASSNSHEIFLDPGAIASHYARGFFLVDLFTSIPYSWILQTYHTVPDGETSNFATIVIELLPLLKLLRLSTLQKFMKQFMQVLGISHIARLVIWLAMFSVLFCHWAACFSYGFPFIVMHATKSRIDESRTWFSHLPNMSNPSEHILELYLYSFYSGLTGLCAVDSSIVSDEDSYTKESAGDRLVTCFLLVLGIVYQMYLIIVVLQWVESKRAPETRYQQIMNNLKFYVSEKQLPPKLEKKLLSYYEYRFQDRYFKENVIVGSLADHLKDEIQMHACKTLMDRVAIFWNLPKPLVGSFVTALRPEIFLPNDIIFKCDDEGNYMYFIGKGTLAVITYAGKEICHLQDGAYFGESSLLYPGFKRPVTVIALEECELFRLDHKDFKRLIPINSDLQQRMKKVVKDQISILVQIEDEDLEGIESGESISNIFTNVNSQEKTSSEDRR